MDLTRQFAANWKERFNFPTDKKLLVAVSGGADSMALVFLLQSCSVLFDVAHCNYQLRGEESDMDEKLVTGWCEQNRVNCHIRRFDTKAFKTEWKKGTQETARLLRYEWFEQLRQEYGYHRIATAHHADDNVETLLINLLKGTGIAGLHGMLPDANNIIRPMLFATRNQIRGLIHDQHIAFREDSSNASDDYLRNSIRHHVIPALEQAQKGASRNIAASIDRFAEAEILYRKAVAAETKKLIEKRGKDYYIPVRKLIQQHPLSTLVYEMMSPFSFTPAQVPQIVQLISAESGKYIDSATHKVLKNRDFLIVTESVAESTDFVVIDAVPCTLQRNGFRYSFELKDVGGDIDPDPNIAYLDVTGVDFPFYLRKWKTGDYFYPLGMGMKKKKISRLLINQKIPLHQKETIDVLENNKKILWVAGIRIDERFKLSADTPRVLKVVRTIINTAG